VLLQVKSFAAKTPLFYRDRKKIVKPVYAPLDFRSDKTERPSGQANLPLQTSR
jgi:hypothetical protein